MLLRYITYCSEPFDFLDVCGTLPGYGLELLIGKVFRGIQCLVIEIFCCLVILGLVVCFLLLFRYLWCTLQVLELILLVTCH